MDASSTPPPAPAAGGGRRSGSGRRDRRSRSPRTVGRPSLPPAGDPSPAGAALAVAPVASTRESGPRRFGSPFSTSLTRHPRDMPPRLPSLAGPAAAALDAVVSRLPTALLGAPKFFEAGWGDLSVVDFERDALMKAAAERESRMKRGDAGIPDPAAWLAPDPSTPPLTPRWATLEAGTRYGTPYRLLEAAFPSPAPEGVLRALPAASRVARARLLTPTDPRLGLGACVVHLAGTGDQGFGRRLALGAPLLPAGVATLVLESPYYNARRPPEQVGARLARVSDLFALGRATIGETLALLRWAATRGGFARLGVSGFSMGGVHAGMVAALAPGPAACAPLLAPRSARAAFCDGALWAATAWRPLTAPAHAGATSVRDAVLAAAAAAPAGSGEIGRASCRERV